MSYLAYPGFDADAHPVLAGSLAVDLHRKELFVASNYPRRDLFAALTRSEERCGLLSGDERIGSKATWEAVLRVRGVVIRGHRLLRRRDSDLPSIA